MYVSSDDGVLHALDATSGTKKWQADLGSANMPVRGALSSGWDYQQLRRLQMGSFMWAAVRRKWMLSMLSPASGLAIHDHQPGRSSPTVVDGTLFIGDGNGYLYALNARTGSELWKTQGCDYPTPAVLGGLVDLRQPGAPMNGPGTSVPVSSAGSFPSGRSMG